MKKLLLLALVGLLAGCGGEEEAAPEAPEAPPAEEATPEAPAEPVAEPEAPAEPEEPALPAEPEAATPAAQTEGEVTVTAVQCTVDGAPIFYDSFATPGIAVSPDGANAYLVDGDRKLRRYTIGGQGETCTLTLDTAFGEGGMLELGFREGLGGRVEQIATDSQGRVYVSSGMSGSVRVTDGAITRCADSMGALSMAPDGSWGISVFASTVKKITWTADGCTAEEFTYPEPYDSSPAFSFSASNLFVAGSIGTNSYRMQRYNAAGTATAGPRWGGTELNDPAKICSPGNVVTGSRGPVVVDQNCRALIVTSGGGTVAARINGMHLIGLRYPWIENITEPRAGVAFVAASHERGRGTRHYDNFVFRVSGL